MTIPRELSELECVQLIQSGGVGRLAFDTHEGLEIYPLNFAVEGRAILFRTTAYSKLGTRVPGTDVAFEVDHLDPSARRGWSVVLKGRAEVIEEPAEVDMLRELGKETRPWAQGARRLYVRVPWKEITGREVGEEWVNPTPVPAHQWLG